MLALVLAVLTPDSDTLVVKHVLPDEKHLIVISFLKPENVGLLVPEHIYCRRTPELP